MTKQNARKGMIPYKKSYGRDDIDYDYIENIPYKENVSTRDIVEGLRADIHNGKVDNMELQNQLSATKEAVILLERENKQIKKEIAELRDQYHTALKGVLSR